jgi:hypothetical protein
MRWRGGEGQGQRHKEGTSLINHAGSGESRSVGMVRGLVWFVLFAASSLAFYRVNDRIVWDICRRERRPYPQAWTFSLYWQWRTIVGGWYTDAKRAGLLIPKAAATAAILIASIGSVVMGIVDRVPG